jgi:hypothetical protein
MPRHPPKAVAATQAAKFVMAATGQSRAALSHTWAASLAAMRLTELTALEPFFK